MFKKRPVIIALAAAVLAMAALTLVLSNVWGQITVVVAKKNIEAGTTLTADMVGLKAIPKVLAGKGVYTSISKVEKKILGTSRFAGDLITADTLEEAARGLRDELDEGVAIISLNIPISDGLSKIIKTGDMVSIIGTKGESYPSSTIPPSSEGGGAEEVSISSSFGGSGAIVSRAKVLKVLRSETVQLGEVPETSILVPVSLAQAESLAAAQDKIKVVLVQ